MLPFDRDEDPVRPVGARSRSGRPMIGLRQGLTILMVLVLGGGLGTAAYFLSDFDLRGVLAWLDVADMGGAGPRLSLPLDQEGRRMDASGLLAPPRKAGEAQPGPASSPASPSAPPVVLPAVAGAQPIVAGAPPPAARPGTAGPTPAYTDMPEQSGEQPLPPAPDKTLLSQTPDGALPVISADGRQPWKVYARPADPPAGRPRLAVLVAGLGLDRAATEAAIARLPGIVSLGFSPYAPDLANWIAKARAAGHEILVGLPVETADYPADDPGPLGLLVQAKPADIASHLDTILASAPGTVGVYAPPSRFTASAQMAPVLATLLQRGLLYVGDGVQGTRVPAWAGIGLVADRDPWREAMDARLAAASAAVKTQGAALVEIATPSPLAFQRLTAWLSGLPGQNITAVPVSSVAHNPGQS